MTYSLTLSLDADTWQWPLRQAAVDQIAPEVFVQSILHELADPESVEGDLMDRLLAQSADYFSAVMTLEEQEEERAEVLDYLCRRIVEGYTKHTGTPLTANQAEALRQRLTERSHLVWQSR